MSAVDSATGGADSFAGAVTVAAPLTTAIVGGLATSDVLRLTGLTTSSIAVSWSASLADGTHDAAAGYDLRRSPQARSSSRDGEDNDAGTSARRFDRLEGEAIRATPSVWNGARAGGPHFLRVIKCRSSMGMTWLLMAASHSAAIRTELNAGVKHRTNRYLNNRIEQGHRGIKGRYRPMRGFKSPESAARFCQGYDELRNHLHPRSRRSRNIPTNSRRHRFLTRALTALRILEAA